MFEKGEYVVCGNKGVCVVEDVTTLNISGIDQERKYYILKPVYMAGSTGLYYRWIRQRNPCAEC